MSDHNDLVEHLRRLETALVANERRRLELEGQLRATDSERVEAQERVHALQGEVEELTDLLRKLRREVSSLLESNRWRLGSRIGDTIERVARKPGREKATERIDRLFERFDRLGEAKVSTPSPEVSQSEDDHRWGLSAEADMAHRLSLYQRYVAEIEEPPAKVEDPPTVRAVVLAKWGDVDSPGTLPGVMRSVRSAMAAGAGATVIVPAAASALRRGLPSGMDLVIQEPSTLLGEVLARTAKGWDEDFTVFLAPGDTLSGDLRDGVAPALVDASPAAIVVDDDRMHADGRRDDPRLKPGFQPDLLLEHDYIGNGALVSTDVLRGLTEPLEESRDLVRGILLSLHEHGRTIAKVDAVLLHRAAAADDCRAAPADQLRFVEQRLDRRGLTQRADIKVRPTGVRVRFRVPDEPLVSIIIPFRDRVDLLRDCLDSIRRLTTYPRYELVLVDNGSTEPETAEYLRGLAGDERIRVLRDDGPFNYSRINNEAAAQARGRFLVFLNNDTRVLSPEWLEDLTGLADLDGVGTVGAHLHFGDGRIQHAGVVIGVQGFATHLFAGAHAPFLPAEMIEHTRNCSAVTGACMAVRADRFRDVGGFDEEFIVTGSDVELGLRFLRNGYRNVVTPRVRLFHYEKQSRAGIAVNPIDVRRSLRLYQPYLREGDPFWNRALSRRSPLMLPRTGPEPSYLDFLEEVNDRLETTARTAGDRAIAKYLARWDASARDLAGNAAVLAAAPGRRPIALRSATWFVPTFDNAYRGGIHTILRVADFFSREHGTLNRIVLYDRYAIDLDRIEGLIRQAFPTLRMELHTLAPGDDEASLPSSDVGICTLWNSAYHLLRYNQCGAKFYFVQDYEPVFHSGNALAGLVEQTYRFGFPGIANTEGVAEAYRAYGNEALAFTPGVDRNLYHPAERSRSGSPVRIVFYGRPRNARNGFELGAQALRQIKQRYGNAVEIVSAGGVFNPSEHGLDGVLDNLGVLPNSAEVAELYRGCDIGLVFMYSKHPSYQPLEYMASGCATVTNFNEANLWLLEDRRNCLLAMPTVSGVVDAISALIEDPALRQHIVKGGLGTVAELDWEPQLRRISRFVREGAA